MVLIPDCIFRFWSLQSAPCAHTIHDGSNLFSVHLCIGGCSSVNVHVRKTLRERPAEKVYVVQDVCVVVPFASKMSHKRSLMYNVWLCGYLGSRVTEG